MYTQLKPILAAGDIQLYQQWTVWYRSSVLAYIQTMLGQSDADLNAEDLCQETFCKAYCKLETMSGADRSVYGWLRAIARNTVIDAIRRRKAVHVPLDEERLIPASSGWMPEQALLQEERMRFVYEAISNLPKNQRTILLLRGDEELSYREIARRLRRTENSVKSMLHRARENIKEQMRSYYSEQ